MGQSRTPLLRRAGTVRTGADGRSRSERRAGGGVAGCFHIRTAPVTSVPSPSPLTSPEMTPLTRSPAASSRAPKITLSLSSFHAAASREDSAGKSRLRVLSGTRGATPTPVRPSQGLTSFARPACLETCFHQGCQQG